MHYRSGDNAFCFVNMLSLNNAILCEKLQKSSNINISCLQDKALNAKFYKCEIASISYVLALLCKMLDGQKFKDLDEGFLSAESCISEEEALEILDFLKSAKVLIFDKNLKFYKDFENIKYFMYILSKEFNLRILDSCEKEYDFSKSKLGVLKELDNYDGLVVFKSKLNDNFLHCSKQFLQLAKFKHLDEVNIQGKNLNLNTKLYLDENLSGTIGFLNDENEGLDFVKICIKEAR